MIYFYSATSVYALATINLDHRVLSIRQIFLNFIFDGRLTVSANLYALLLAFERLGSYGRSRENWVGGEMLLLDILGFK